MLNYLKLENVGPSPEMEIDFKPRMNFLAGDNGLGKTFLLDIAWWALTRTWARSQREDVAGARSGANHVTGRERMDVGHPPHPPPQKNVTAVGESRVTKST